MSKPVDSGSSDPTNQPGRDTVSLLSQIQRQLLYLEKKLDNLIGMLHDNQHREGPPVAKSYRNKSFSDVPSFSGPRKYRKYRKQETHEEKDRDQVFYSKYRRKSGPSGPDARKKRLFHKEKRK